MARDSSILVFGSGASQLIAGHSVVMKDRGPKTLNLRDRIWEADATTPVPLVLLISTHTKCQSQRSSGMKTSCLTNTNSTEVSLGCLDDCRVNF